MPLYLSVHRNRAGQHKQAAQLMIVAAELSRWTATQNIEIKIKASGLAADTHDFIVIADYPDEASALAMALHFDLHDGVETKLTRLLGFDELHPLADKSGDEFGGIE